MTNENHEFKSFLNFLCCCVVYFAHFPSPQIESPITAITFYDLFYKRKFCFYTFSQTFDKILNVGKNVGIYARVLFYHHFSNNRWTHTAVYGFN